MNNSPLEFLARIYDNVVLYDANGNPSIFVRFPKMKSIELDASLPDHTHPAFITNGVEQSELLIGKYKACELAADGTLYSLPNMPPRVSLGADPFLTRLRAFGGGVSGKTVADSGFLLLLAAKNGWVPKGNNNYSYDYRDGTGDRGGPALGKTRADTPSRRDFAPVRCRGEQIVVAFIAGSERRNACPRDLTEKWENRLPSHVEKAPKK